MDQSEISRLEHGSIIQSKNKKYVIIYMDFFIGLGMKYGIVRLYEEWSPPVRFVKYVTDEDLEYGFKLVKQYPLCTQF